MSEISDLFAKGTKISFKKGFLFMSPKKKPLGVYLLSEGFVVSYSKSVEDKRRIQTILKQGDLFPLAWAIHDIKRSFYLEALTDGNAYLLDKQYFLDQINKDHKITLEMINALLSYLMIYTERVENFEYNTVREKLVSRILFFANRFGISMKKQIVINLPVTHKLIAESINVSRENITRELKILENEKIISFRNRQLIILDLQRLKKAL